MGNLLLIESPGKIKKLSQILGSGWIVKASSGHIRELANDGEDALGFDLEGDRVHCRYEPRGDRGKKVLAELRQAVKQATEVYIATDPDREGETIGWHLAQELRLKQPKRVTYTEITKPAVTGAIAHPRTLNANLIAAGRARDCLDKLVGYKGSKHVVWALKNGAKSMGRVQSATLHLLCLREREIQAFKPQDYWSVWVEYAEGFRALYRGSLSETENPTQAQDDAAESTETTTPESERVLSQAEADRLVEIARTHPHQVVKIESKTTSSPPPPPFITSTLQQAAGAKLRFSPETTMKVAQSLYEAGYITYMRTDSVALSEQFCADVRKYLQQQDPTNIPHSQTKHRASHIAQEAHEAIRPTDVFQTPDKLSLNLIADEAKLYDLIWRRAVASQCSPAQLGKTRIITQSGTVFWEARGQILLFPGYTIYWHNISGDSQLPTVKQGQPLQLKKAGADQKQTQAPPRYTEPKLVQLMEQKGIGRPSTYSPTIKTLKEREYVVLSKGKLQPTALGMDLDAVLERVLPDLIQADFTAQMERQLDAIAGGKLDWERYLTGWHREYFAPAIAHAVAEIRKGIPRGEFKTQETGSLADKKKRQPVNHFDTDDNARLAQMKKEQPVNPFASENSGMAAPSKKRKPVNSSPSQSDGTPQAAPIEILCPNCGNLMTKVLSKSEKMKADHFLSCDKWQNGCGTVMFLNVKTGTYELPYSHRPQTPKTDSPAAEYPCPLCGTPMERYEYNKDGQNKVMWRCANPETKRTSCKEVAFFQSKQGGWWSPKFGELSAPKSS
ncbi:MAG TPA: type I DNA topoisomerase [Oscillatoriaceae cyanobacterium M33_DOE_052]|nr:type I DNA topoisomerase [Oscillatoriaceae cyanobacterium M33_DOE_052]